MSGVALGGADLALDDTVVADLALDGTVLDCPTEGSVIFTGVFTGAFTEE